MLIRIILCVFLLNSAILAQQTTGNLIGKILDEDGDPIPFVNIVVSGKNQQGTRGAATDEFGFFRILALHVGSYSVRIDHIAKRPVIIEPVIIRLGKTTTLGDVKLTERTLETEEIRITAKRPLIDPTSTVTGANLSLKTIEQLPVQRDHRSIAMLVPQANISYLNDDMNIAGSTGLENMYFIDGMNTTDPNFGRTSTYLPYNFVKEVEVKTGGYEPEYRSALGGIVNVITPSGGNKFTGQAFGFFANDAMRAEPRLGFIEYDVDNFTKGDFGLSLGGPILRDKLWFYSAYSYVVEDKSIGIIDFGMQDDTFRRHVFAGKLTWKATKKTDVILSLFGDPGKRESVAPPGTMPMPNKILNLDLLLGLIEDGGTNISLKARHMLNRNLIINASLSGYDSKSSNTGRTEKGNTEPEFWDMPIDTHSGGYYYRVRYKNRRYNANISSILLLKKHVIKSGFEYETNALDAYTNKETLFKVNENLYRKWYHYMKEDVSNFVSSAYIQDSWSLTSRLHLNFGLRWDGQYFYDADGNQAQRITDQFQPRIGLVIQPGTPGTQKIYGHFGRYYEQVPMNFLYFHFMPRVEFVTWFKEDPRLTTSEGDTTFNLITDILQGVDGLEGQYLDEFVIGYEKEIVNRLKANVSGTYRYLGQVVQSIFDENNNIFYGNPGKGRLSDFPKFTREYTALQLSLERYGSNGLNFLASYVWSRNYGNYSGIYDSEHRLEFPNASRTLCQIEQIPNSTGMLPNDRTHSFKFTGSWAFTSGLSIGTSFYWHSGTPLNEFGGTTYGPPLYSFLVKRGAAGRTPSIWDLNFRLTYKFGKLFRLCKSSRLILDIFHVAGQREVVDIDQIHYRILDPEGNQANENPSYLEPIKFQQPMTIRLGFEAGF